MTWTMDESGVITHSDGHKQLTLAEFQRQAWPPCPSCGTRVDVSPVAVPDRSSLETSYIPGRVACPRGCVLG